MQIDVRRQGIELDEAMTAHLERRLDFALGRLDHRVMRVEVHLAHELLLLGQLRDLRPIGEMHAALAGQRRVDALGHEGQERSERSA